MIKFLLHVGKFIAVLNVCVVASVFAWERFVAGTIYYCTDPGFLDFLSPGDWAHSQHGDTLRAGWSMTGLWWLWYFFVVASVIVSLAFTVLPWRFRSSHKHI